MNKDAVRAAKKANEALNNLLLKLARLKSRHREECKQLNTEINLAASQLGMALEMALPEEQP